MEKYEKVLQLLKDKGGRLVVSDESLAELLSRDEKAKVNLVYRLTTYISYIRRFAKLEVKALRAGRKVVAYELVRAGVTSDGDPVWQESKYALDIRHQGNHGLPEGDVDTQR